MSALNTMPNAIQTLMLERNDWVPNNPRLPVIIYRDAIASQAGDLATRIEEVFRANGWPPQWRYGIYDFHHYHTQGHEALGVASGQEADIRREAPNEAQLAAIDTLPFPDRDPVLGSEGGVTRYWSDPH